MKREIREITLPGGETLLAQVRILDEDEVPPGADDFQFDDVGTRDQLIARAQQLNEVISGVGSAVLRAARQACPDEVSATFGVELAVKSGKALAAVLADGEAKAAVSVTLTWHAAHRRDGDGEDGTPGTTRSTDGTGTPGTAPQGG
ncbi:CU044_2847 family protein [Streptomyces reniochalinae]|uniref:CU044_2847 family protein n=1 Tax=Streptomyces reniochalinae TaxID=2250578 RepID=UPI001C6938BA|nr:CU044_2847 family protein [Streptomyces reniochalinae]